MAFSYIKERAKLFRSLADHCHDKAIEVAHPRHARDWVVLMDTCLWCADSDAETDLLGLIFKDASDA